MAKKRLWQHKNYKAIFTGGYQFDRSGDRSFILTGKSTNGPKGKERTISFESHEAAKKAGWSSF